ncbi:hypothetical protein K435DRAFT_594643, partial [Dendrothele bispora CBS 962.96]
MDLLDIGRICAACNQQDFLPILCLHCSLSFCGQHINAHHCHPTHQSHLPSPPIASIVRCASCNDPSVISCSRCQRPYCPHHRHPNDHTCSSKPSPTPAKNQAARDLLAAHFPSTSRTANKNAAKKPAVKNQKLELMKMRHRALAADPKLQSSTMSAQQRSFVKVQINDGPEKIFWLEKTVIAGKAFDLLANQMGIPASNFDHYRLCKKSDQQLVALQNDLVFADQVADGDSIIL